MLASIMEQQSTYYELSYLLAETLDEEGAMRVAGSLRDSIEKARAAIIEDGLPKKRALAYPIKRQSHAYFGWIRFMATPEVIAGIESAIKKETEVLRSSLIKTKPEARRETKARRKPQPVAVTKEKQEEIAAIDKRLEEILGEEHPVAGIVQHSEHESQ